MTVKVMVVSKVQPVVEVRRRLLENDVSEETVGAESAENAENTENN